jgi:hypothetical protein
VISLEIGAPMMHQDKGVRRPFECHGFATFGL